MMLSLCMVLFGLTKRTHSSNVPEVTGAEAWTLSRYKQLRSECNWRPFDVYGGMRTIVADAPETLRRGWYKAHACTVDASASDATADLLIMRFGEPSGTPVMMESRKWVGWTLDYSFPQAVVNTEDGLVRVIGWRYWPVDATTGEALTLPPLHNHHGIFLPATGLQGSIKSRRIVEWWRLYNDTSWLTVSANQYGNAADSYCEMAFGGENCTLRGLPNGSAAPWYQSRTLSLVINDLRPPGTQGSYPVYYEVAFRIWRPRGPQTSLPLAVTLLNIATGIDPPSTPLFPRLNGSMFHTFNLPPRTAEMQNVVRFIQLEWPCPGRILQPQYWHTHSTYFREGLIVSGDLRSAMKRAGLADAERRAVPFDMFRWMKLKEQLMQRARLRLLCQYTPRTELLPATPGAMPIPWDRESRGMAGECMEGGIEVRVNETRFGMLCLSRLTESPAHAHCNWFVPFAPKCRAD